MSKFKVGDEVVCVCSEDSDLFLHDIYTVEEILIAEGFSVTEYKLKGVSRTWRESRFESVEDWSEHQVAASMEDELELTQHQVKSLQKFKKEALYLLRAAQVCCEERSSLKYEIDFFLEYSMLSELNQIGKSK